MLTLFRHVSRLSTKTHAGLLLGSVAILSFLPSRLKLLLHTRGPLHGWAHVYVFASVAAVLLARTQTPRVRYLHTFKLVLFGIGIEFAQARANPAAIEVQDVGFDLLGAVVGLLIANFRASARTSSSPYSAPVTQ